MNGQWTLFVRYFWQLQIRDNFYKYQNGSTDYLTPPVKRFFVSVTTQKAKGRVVGNVY